MQTILETHNRRLVRLSANTVQTQRLTTALTWIASGPLGDGVCDPDLDDIVCGLQWVRGRSGTFYLGALA